MKMSNRAVVRRVALVTLGDPGIGTYTYELAEALSACGVRVDVYTHFPSCTLPLPRHHRLFPVLGSALIRQRYLLRLHAASPGTVRLDPEGAAHGPSCIPRFLKRTIRESYLSIELATWLRAQRYDFVWTQWPDLYGSRISFWSAARALGLPLVHTVHNVFPHEQAADDRAHYRHVYDRSRLVIVHSRAARDVLAREFPAVSSKILISPHGLYTTTYPRRPEARDRVRRSLGVSSAVPLVLFFGGVRPYKNVDVVIRALAADRIGQIALLVAGRESGYPESSTDDPLARTRRLATEWNVLDRVRLIPGIFDYDTTAELLEACDIVVLPYIESYGSGLLLLAMSFGKYIVATRTGGMDEYLRDYPAHDVIDTPTDDNLLAALHRSARLIQSGGSCLASRPAHLEWSHIVRELLPRLVF
jgi:glycosyltransferase involved in cell wall biosynthesis